MKIIYDKEADVLYVVFHHSTADSDYLESQPGVVYRIDSESRNLLGLTIVDFSSKFGDRADIPAHIAASLPQELLAEIHS